MDNPELEEVKNEFLRQIYETPLVALGVELRYLFKLRFEWREIEINGNVVGGISAIDIPNNKINHITTDCLDGCIKARLLQDKDVIEAIREKIREDIKNYTTASNEDKSKIIMNLANWIFIDQMLAKDILNGTIKTDLEFLTVDQEIDEVDPVFASIIKEEEQADIEIWNDIEMEIATILQQMDPSILISVYELAEVENMADGEALDNEIFNDVLCSKISNIKESDLIRYYEDMGSYVTDFENLLSALKNRLMKTDGFMAPLYLYFADMNDQELNSSLFDKASKRDIAETLANAVLLIEQNGELKEKVKSELQTLSNIQFITFLLELFRMQINNLDDEVLTIIKSKIQSLSSLDRQALGEVFKDESEQNEIRAILMQVEENEQQISEDECKGRIEQFNLLGGVKQSFPMLKFSPDEDPAIKRILTNDDEELSDDGTSDYDEYEDEEEQDPYYGVDESLYEEIERTVQEREDCIKLIKELDQLSDKQLMKSILEMAKRVDGRTMEDIENVGLMDFTVKYLKNRIMCMERKNVIVLLAFLFKDQISYDNVIMRTAEYVMEEFKEQNIHPGNGDGR